MPVNSVVIERQVRKRLPKIPLHVHKRIIQVIAELVQNPLKGVKLHGELEDYYKYRVGDYRIVYSFDPVKSQLSIVKVEHRQGVYK